MGQQSQPKQLPRKKRNKEGRRRANCKAIVSSRPFFNEHFLAYLLPFVSALPQALPPKDGRRGVFLRIK